jgi:hypothetical protein
VSAFGEFGTTDSEGSFTSSRKLAALRGAQVGTRTATPGQMRRIVLVFAAACSSSHHMGQADGSGAIVDAVPDAVPDAPLDAPPTGAPEVFAPNQNDAHYLTSDGSYVYWTNDVGGSGQVMKLAVSGGTPVQVAGSQDSPQGIAIDATGLYWEKLGWLNGGAGAIMTLVGSTPTTIVAAHYARTLAIDAANVYWSSDDGAILKVAKTGGTPTTLATVQVSAIATDGSYVYFLDQDTNPSLQRVSVAGGAPEVVVAGHSQSGLHVAHGRVLWKDCDTSACSL